MIMAVNDPSDPLPELLQGARLNNREVIWLWLGLYVHEGIRLDRNTCNGATMRDAIAEALKEAQFTPDIRAKKDLYLLPEEQMAWITTDRRQIQWLTPKVENLTNQALPRGFAHLQGRERLIAALDIWKVDLEKKNYEVEKLHGHWRRHIAQDSQFEWFTDKNEGTKRCVCAWEWLQKKYPMSQPLISNYQELLMFFDQEDFGSNERTAMIREIRRRWSRKQFDERAADKKQVNVMLSTTVIAQLDALAEAHGLKRAQIIENLVRMEADAGVYLADD